MIVLNHQMSEFLLSRGNTPIPETLELKILEGFYEHADTIVFAFYKDRLEHLDYDTVISRYGDLTGFEASTNRIHIDDYIHNENFTTNEIINIGFSSVQLVQNLWNKLRDDECIIILSSDLESEFGSNASLTFHKKRANETLTDDLKNCAQAVYICDNNHSLPY